MPGRFYFVRKRTAANSGRLIQRRSKPREGVGVINFERASADTSREEQSAPKAATTGEEAKPRRRGFAALDPAILSEIARKGGRAAHRAGTAHEFTSEEARIAGKKGSKITHEKRKTEKETTTH